MLPLNPSELKRSIIAIHVNKRVAMALLIVMVAILAIPSWIKWDEQSKASESYRYLACVKMAQEQYHANHGQYAKNVRDLDMVRPEPTFFAVGEVTPGSTGSLNDSWSLTLTRFGDAFLCGNYTVTFNQNGSELSR